MAKKQKTNSYVPAIILTIVLIVALFAYKLSNLDNQKNKTSATPVAVSKSSPIVSPAQQDSINDGVYTNHTHGFNFKYPINTFKYQQTLDNGVTWSNEDFKDLNSTRTNLLSLSTIIENKESGYLENLFTQTKDLLPGQTSTIRFWVATKLEDLTIDGNKISLVYFGSIPYSEVDTSHSYYAFWEQNGKINVISLTATALEKLDANRNLFENLVKSIEFI
jgi:hypothetical protein